MDSGINTADKLFDCLSEEAFGALMKFMRLSPEDREQVLGLLRELSIDK